MDEMKRKTIAEMFIHTNQGENAAWKTLEVYWKLEALQMYGITRGLEGN